VPATGLKVGVVALAAQATVLLAQNANRKRKRLKKLSAFQ
jgi:hypothetical protein